jgi:hypothetical protein
MKTFTNLLMLLSCIKKFSLVLLPALTWLSMTKTTSFAIPPLSLTSDPSQPTAATADIAALPKSLNSYTDPAYFYDVPFGTHSHWLQPWRAYLETVPAKVFLDGVGINMGLERNRADPNLVAQMLSKHGIRNGRLEIVWGAADYHTEKISDTWLRQQLQAAKKWGIRPVILLTAHQGYPTPALYFPRTVTKQATAGSQTVELDDTSNLIVGRSGISNLTDNWQAEALVTAINGKQVTLSKRLPKAINAGSQIQMATLKYLPFSAPGTTDYQQTIQGWQKFVGEVARFASDALGTTNSADKGFDLEIWNEATIFGSQFLSIDNYYDRPPVKYDKNSIWTNLITATADYVKVHPAQFKGVKISNGFANTSEKIAASTLPKSIDAISKHPYASRLTYPAQTWGDTRIDALGQKTSFIPSYSVLFPEFYGTALSGNNLVRDFGPFTEKINGAKHGRYARVIDRKVVPTEVWITEVGIAPTKDGFNQPSAANPAIDRQTGLSLKAKTTARYYTFYLNKGVTKVQLFSASVGDDWLGIVQDNFLEYAKTNNVYPQDDRDYVSPALKITGRIVGQMKRNLDPNLTKTRQIRLDSIRDPHDRFQFVGDGTAAHPNLYDRDVFAFLPYQVNSQRFVIPYYVMTRDVTKNLPPEQFAIQISKLKAQGATVSVYDPMHDRTLPVSIDRRGRDFLSLTLPATDYPYLLIIQEREK